MSGYTKVTADEYKSRNTWPADWYGVTIETCEQKVSKNGNNYLKAQCAIYNDQGHARTVFANIMMDGDMAWMLRNAAEATNLLEKYDAGKLQPTIDIANKSCWAKVGIKIDKTGQYDDQNVIREFRAEPPQEVKDKHKAKAGSVGEMLEDDLPNF